LCTEAALSHVVLARGENTVALVNPEHPEAINKIKTRKHPQDIAISRDGPLAYVAEMGTMEVPGNTVAVINVRSRQIVKRFSLGRATLPHLLALSRDERTLWAACAPENAIVELDAQRSYSPQRQTKRNSMWLTSTLGR
jgi:hypothetical protein